MVMFPSHVTTVTFFMEAGHHSGRFLRHNFLAQHHSHTCSRGSRSATTYNRTHPKMPPSTAQ